MDIILKLLDEYTVLSPQEKKQRQELILSYKNPVGILFDILQSKDTEKQHKRYCINALCDIALKPAYKKKISRILYPSLAEKIISIDDPKIRKAAAKLIGIINKKDYSQTLIDAVEREDTMYVLDSLILALGYTDYSKRSLGFLKNYKPKSTEKKHLEKEKTAIQKAISSLTPVEKIENVLLKDLPIVLTYCAELKDSLSSEMDDYGLAYKHSKIIKNSLSVKPNDYRDVFGLRCFFEALIYIGEFPLGDLNDMIKKIFVKAESLFSLESYKFRIDLQYLDPKDKKETMDKLLNIIDEFDNFESSPSNYQFELRLIFSDNSIKAFISVPSLDDRFSYRKETIPASINPVVAASIMRALKPYFKADAKVLDPFVGTGTMLFERDYILPCEELIGVDVKKETLYKAKKNFLNKDIPSSFLVSDILEADLNQEFDEIISNMPFGRRVSTHNDNTKLYQGFISQLKSLLKVGGFAFLYTNEKQLLKSVLRGEDKLILIDEIVVESGGLYPSIFIIKREK